MVRAQWALTDTVFVFVLALLVVEPLKRQKIARLLEKRLLQSEADYTARVETLLRSVDERLAGLTEPCADGASPVQAHRPEHHPSLLPPAVAKWVNAVWSYVHAFHVAATRYMWQLNPFSEKETVMATASATGVFIGGVLMYWFAAFL